MLGADVLGADVLGADVLGADVLGADVRNEIPITNVLIFYYILKIIKKFATVI